MKGGTLCTKFALAGLGLSSLSNFVSFCKKWYIRDEVCGLTKKKENKTGSSQVGAISKAQKYSRNNYWKHLEKLFFQKNFLKIFFSKKSIFFRKSHNAEELKKMPFRLDKRFYKPKTSKNARGYLLIESENFRKKSRIVPKKTKKNQTKENLWSRIYFWKHKKFVV